MSDFFEATVADGADAKLTSNWLMGEVLAYLNKQQKELKDVALTPAGLSKMVQLIEKGGDPEEIVKAKGLVQISDEGTLRKVVTEILDNNEQSIEDFKNGKDRAIGFLVGQIMKATKGQANPPLVNKILLEEINKR